MPEQFSRKELFELYRIALEEYRFEVKLNWDRAMYYMVFNSALISAATGLLRLSDRGTVDVVVAAIYVAGFFCCLIGSAGIRKGHQYYRRTIVKKTLLEDLLGLMAAVHGYTQLHSLSIGTTIGQGEHLRVLHDTERWLNRKLRPASITSYISLFLILLMLINAIGAVTAVYLFSSHQVSEKNTIRLVPISFIAGIALRIRASIHS